MSAQAVSDPSRCVWLKVISEHSRPDSEHTCFKILGQKPQIIFCEAGGTINGKAYILANSQNPLPVSSTPAPVM